MLWAPDATADASQEDQATGTLRVALAAGARAAFLLGHGDAIAAVGDPFEAAGAWAQGRRPARSEGSARPTPTSTGPWPLPRSTSARATTGRPDADGQPGGPGSKLVCDIFRWRDVWSRDFGSGFGPGGLAAGLVDAVLATLDYEAERYSGHPPAGLKVSDDTSQGGSGREPGVGP